MPPDRTKGNAPAAVTAEASGPQNPQTNESTRNMNSVSILTFDETTFDVVDHQNQPALRGAQIGNALGYSPEKASDAITKLYDRNRGEFTEHMTGLVKLRDLGPQSGGAGQVREVRVFSLRGAYLLGMFARTDRAAAFRSWVLDVMEGLVAPQEVSRMTHPQRLSHIRERRIIMKELGKCANLGEAVELYHDLRDVTRMLGRYLSATLEQLAPGVRQQLLALEGGSS